jgi:phosphohistidine swiveling domain-containing protein
MKSCEGTPMSRTFPQFGYNPVTGEWNDSLLGDFLWSSVNVSEAVPDVMTPSTWSLWWIYHYEASPFEFPGKFPFCGNICGRPFLNLSLIASLYRAVGKDVRKELQGDMIGSAPAELDIPYIPFSPLEVIWKALPGMLKAQRRASHDIKQMPGFLATLPGWCRTTRAAIQNCPDASSLLSLWQASIKSGVVQACSLLRSVTMSLADPATKLRLDLSTLVGESDANAILSNLSGSSGDLASLGPLLGLAQVVNGRMSREVYLERYGHRGPHEMELFAPGSDDDPAWFEKRLAEFTQSAVDVDALLARQRAEHAAAWANFESRFPAKVRFTQRELEKVAASAKNREAVRSEVTRMARLVRSYLLRVGEVTGLGNGIFFLSLDEMTDLLTGDRTAVARIPARCETYQRYSTLPPYPAIIIGCFDPFAWAADPKRRSDYFDSRQSKSVPAATITSKGDNITGFAGAAGIVEGIVRRLDKPEDGCQLQAGEILVTVTTNVGWTPLFPRLAAIVTDVGAPLSHAAIVARELGIPAVVGCGNATMRLKTGDRVRVDGGRGTVEIIGQE